MTTLHGSLRRGSRRAAAGDGIGDLLPVRSLEIPTPQGIPLIAVRIDEGHGLVVGPARWRQASWVGGGYGGGGNSGGGSSIGGD